jgi:hypothetical protein
MNAAPSALHRASLSRLGAQWLAAVGTRLGRLGLSPLSVQEFGDSITSDIIHVLQHFIFNGFQVGISEVGQFARPGDVLNQQVRDLIERATFRGRIHDQSPKRNPPNHPIALIESQSIVIPPPPHADIS